MEVFLYFSKHDFEKSLVLMCTLDYSFRMDLKLGGQKSLPNLSQYFEYLGNDFQYWSLLNGSSAVET